MNLKEAKNIFEEICELCGRINDSILDDALESIYRELECVENVEDVLQLTSDLMLYVDEVTWDDDEVKQIKSDIQELYNNLQDEID
ncbi:MAG TPA: hypothetical protein VMX17_17340 [Candidatus Glassbacteria bacterium]|nr:hypothetical protein [Candidatus Glassbacteria bacterium]